MSIEISKPGIDLGIIADNIDEMLNFYGEVIGLEFQAEIPMPMGDGTMHRFKAGDSIIKIIKFDEPVPTAKGGMKNCAGYRYWTISCNNIQDCVDKATEAGRKVIVPVTEIRPGISIAMIIDPDGNWLELLQET